VRHLIHKPLEGFGHILEIKGHANKFEEAEWSDDGSLGHIIRFHGNLIVCMGKINFAEDGSAMEGCRIWGMG